MATKPTFGQEHIAPLELRSALEAIGSTVERSGKSTLFRRGDKARAKVSLSLEGTNAISRTLGPGSLLGLPATLSGEPYSLTATVAEVCQLDFIRREATSSSALNATIDAHAFISDAFEWLCGFHAVYALWYWLVKRTQWGRIAGGSLERVASAAGRVGVLHLRRKNFRL